MEGESERGVFIDLSSDEAMAQGVGVVAVTIAAEVEASKSQFGADCAAAKAVCAVARQAEKASALCRLELKGKAVCIEDGKAKRTARESKSIARFFSSSRNPSNNKPLRIGGDHVPSNPPSISSHYASLNKSLNNVSLGTKVLGSQPTKQSQNKSSGNALESHAAHEIHRQLRQDMVKISDGEEDLDSDDDLEEISLPKKPRLNYDQARRFENEWAAKLVWVEPIRTSDGRVHLVKYTICSIFEKNPKILGPKWDTLTKHEGRRKATFDLPKYNVKKGEWYISKTSRHQINLRLAAARQPASVLQQVNRSTSMALSKKIVQLSTIYQILSASRPMLEYEERQALYAFLNVPNLPRMHWSNSSAWKMAKCMYSQVKEVVKKKISGAHFVAITCDEVTSVDNGSWICIHAYVVDNYIRIPHLVSL